MYTVQCTLNSVPLLHFSAAPGHLHSADLAPAQAVLVDKLVVVMQHLHLTVSAVPGHRYFATVSLEDCFGQKAKPP